jgi:phosphoribosylglycinamide formyltransferase-1
MARLKAAVLISGRGSNLQALIDACADPAFPAEIVAVISNVAEAAGLARAKDAGISTRVIDHRQFDSREAFDAALDAELEKSKAELVCLAGFMRLLSEWFVGKWRDRVINIHPSLLPAFTGRNTHERVLKAGVRFTGCTVHFVRPDMDQGPIIIQAAVPVHAGDDAAALAARVLEAEHRIYPEAVRLIAEGRVRVVADVVRIEGAAAPGTILVNPERSR